MRLHAGLAALMALSVAACSEPEMAAQAEQEAQIVREMITAIKAISLDRYPAKLMKRFNQAKSLACLDADFQVPDNLPESLRQGLFAQPGHYPAKLRFANASKEDDRDKDFRGLSIKVFGMGDDVLWGEPGVQDFVLNSYPALFAGTPEEFLAFIEATQNDALWRFFIKPSHWDSLWIVFQGREQISSPFDIAYWSTTPYRFGVDSKNAVKYSAQPCSTVQSQIPDQPGADYLSQNMAKHLAQAPACFDFMVQFQQDPDVMPIEDASVIWDEAAAPLQAVARITVPLQDFGNDQKSAECESLSFNPWQSLAAHQPLGGINRVRQTVYAELSAFRREQNGNR